MVAQAFTRAYHSDAHERVPASDSSLLMRVVRATCMLEADRRIVVKNPAAAFAEHHFVAVAKILEELGAQQDLARRSSGHRWLRRRPSRRATSCGCARRRSRRASECGHQLLAFGSELIELLLIDGGALAGLRLFGLHLLLFFLERGFGLLDVGVQAARIPPSDRECGRRLCECSLRRS